MASIFGASASLIVSAPLDVIKTRIQNKNFENPESGFTILKNMAKNEGEYEFYISRNDRKCLLTKFRILVVLQGSYSQAANDWTQARV